MPKTCQIVVLLFANRLYFAYVATISAGGRLTEAMCLVECHRRVDVTEKSISYKDVAAGAIGHKGSIDMNLESAPVFLERYVVRPRWRVAFSPADLVAWPLRKCIVVAGKGPCKAGCYAGSPAMAVLCSETGQLVAEHRLGKAVTRLIKVDQSGSAVAVASDGTAEYWQDVTQPNSVGRTLPLPTGYVLDVVVRTPGKPIAYLFGHWMKPSKVKLIVPDKTVLPCPAGESLHASSEGRFAAVYRCPNRFLIFDLVNPHRNCSVGAARVGGACGFWLPGTSRFVVASGEGEPLEQLNRFLQSALRRARSRGWVADIDEQPPESLKFPDVESATWLRCYEVSVRERRLHAECVWESRLPLSSNPKKVTWDGRRIIVVFHDEVVFADPDGTVRDTRTVTKHVTCVSDADEAGTVWVGLVDGNIVTLSEALTEGGRCDEQWPVGQLAIQRDAVLWASNACKTSSAYAVSSYDWCSGERMATWRYPMPSHGVLDICISCSQDNTSVYLCDLDSRHDRLRVYSVRGDRDSEPYVVGETCPELPVGTSREHKVQKLFCCDNNPALVTSRDVTTVHEWAGKMIGECLEWWRFGHETGWWLVTRVGPDLGGVTLMTVFAVAPSFDGRFIVAIVGIGSGQPRFPATEEAVVLIDETGRYQLVRGVLDQVYAYRRIVAIDRRHVLLGHSRGGYEHYITCLDVKIQKVLWMHRLSADMYSDAVDVSGEKVALGLADGAIEIRRVIDGEVVTHWQAHSGAVLALLWHRFGQLASGGADGAIMVWSLSNR
ncbi:MAG: hypothetical protein KatS3mg110_2149 [Pirellulaceae bacterium]|nr:MAG: hypothetical protein KatS3mg110_2149 [Pirellulaceae bacterium]